MAVPTPSVTYPDGITPPSYLGIQQARGRIAKHVHRTPLLTSSTLNNIATQHLRSQSETLKGLRVEIAFKCENFQKVGAFKIRGATNALAKYLETHKGSTPLEVFTHSSGNHGQAVAMACRDFSTPERPIKANIIMPFGAPAAKREAVEGYGALVVLCAQTERQQVCNQEIEKARARGADTLLIAPYNEVDVIEGQGTLYLEAAEQVKEHLGWDRPDVVVCPIGGGGCISGVSLAAKGLSEGQVKVVGAEPAAANDCKISFDSKQWHPALPPTTICDGLLTATGSLTFPTIMANVDQILTAEDESVIRAMKFIWQRMKFIAEPSSCVPLATILGTALGGPATAGEGWIPFVEDLVRNSGAPNGVLRVVLVVTGGNVEFGTVLRAFEGVSANV